MCRPSADHTGFDGCLMSISCSIVNRFESDGWGAAVRAAMAAVDAAATNARSVFMSGKYNAASPKFRSGAHIEARKRPPAVPRLLPASNRFVRVTRDNFRSREGDH